MDRTVPVGKRGFPPRTGETVDEDFPPVSPLRRTESEEGLGCPVEPPKKGSRPPPLISLRGRKGLFLTYEP